MPIESPFAKIEDLTVTNPAGTDKRSIGDDHIRALKVVLVRLLNKLGLAETTGTLTIATGSVTPSAVASVFVLDTEAAAAADDLDTIAVTNKHVGELLLVRQSDDARDITYKHGTGNLTMATGADLAPGSAGIWVLFLCTSVTGAGAWREVALTPGTVPVSRGGTGATTLGTSKALQSSSASVAEASAVTTTELGYVGGVTSALQTQLDLKAPLASPALTGNPTAPTQTAGNNSTRLATTEYVVTSFAPLASPTFTGAITTPLTANRALATGAAGALAVSLTTDTELGYVNGVTSAIQTQMNLKAPLASPALTGNPTAPTQLALDNSTKLATTAYVETAVAAVVGGSTFVDPVLSGTIKIADSTGGQFYTLVSSDLVADRNITLPLLTGNDVFVFADFIQTLANKTLTSPVINTALTGNATHVTTDATDATSPTAGGSFRGAGGAAFAKALWVGGLANIAGAVTLQSTLALATANVTGTPTIVNSWSFDANQTIRSTGTVGSATLNLGLYSLTTSSPPRLTFQKSASAVLGTLTDTIDQENLGQIDFAGVNTSQAVTVAFRIRAGQQGAAGATLQSDLLFKSGTSGLPTIMTLRGAGGNLLLGAITAEGSGGVKNIVLDNVSAVIGAATANIVSLAAVDVAAGDAALYIQAEASAGIYALGASFTINTNKFTVAAATGNTVLAGTLRIDDTTDATSISTCSGQTDGGLGVTKALWVGGLANVAGAVTLQSTLGVTGIATLSGGLNTGDATLKVKVIEIGDWNMDATTSVSIAHGLTLANIRNVKAEVQNDSQSLHWELSSLPSGIATGTGAEIEAEAWIVQANTADVIMRRLTGGIFDGVNYDSTSFNRGWITIWYVP